MPKWITAVFVFFLSTTLLTAKAITVEDIIDKHIKASEARRGTAEMSVANELTTTYAEKGYQANLEGVETYRGRTCYKIRMQHLSGSTIYYLIDAKNWYIIRKYVKPVYQMINR